MRKNVYRKKIVAAMIVFTFFVSSFVSAVGTQLSHNVEINEQNENILLSDQREQSFSTDIDKTESEDHNDGLLLDWIFQRISDLFTCFNDNSVIDFIRSMFTFTSVDSSADNLEDTEIAIDNKVQETDEVEVVREDVHEQDIKRDTPVFFGDTGRGDSWWNTDWTYRKQIMIDHTMVDENLTNFPVLIDIKDDGDLADDAKCQNNGNDIVFTDNAGNQLNHEIEFFNGSSGNLTAWVNCTTLSSTEDTTLWMYYGNGSCGNMENVVGVWDSNYIMVQHLQEISGGHFDSTFNDHDASEHVSPDSNMDVPGIVDGADSFDGDDYLEVSGDLVSGDGVTVSFWEYNMNIGSGYGCIFDDWSGSNGLLWQFGDNSMEFQVGNVADWSNNLNYYHGGLVDDTWHYYVVTLRMGILVCMKMELMFLVRVIIRMWLRMVMMCRLCVDRMVIMLVDGWMNFGFPVRHGIVVGLILVFIISLMLRVFLMWGFLNMFYMGFLQ